jgi:Tol biopolymer transport system component
VSPEGAQANSSSIDPSISSDGRYVTFSSEADTLVAGDTNGTSDVFVHDLLLGTTERVSVNSNEAQGNGSSYGSSISDDGRYVTFVSTGTTLVEGDTSGGASPDIFVRDLVLGTTSRVNVALDGSQANNASRGPRLPPRPSAAPRSPQAGPDRDWQTAGSPSNDQACARSLLAREAGR